MRTAAKYALLVALCGAAGGAAFYLSRGSDDGDEPGASQVAWHFRDGQWVRLSPGQVEVLAAERLSRAPDRVRVTGTIRRIDGGPVAGAVAVFTTGDGEHTATADEDGNYRIELAPSFYRVHARAEGLVAIGSVGAPRVPADLGAESDLPAADGASAIAPSLGVFRDLASIDVEMHPAGVIEGVTHDRAGRPVANAVVRAISYAADNPRPIGGTDTATTDADGRFRLLVAEGAHRLEVSHAELAGVDPSALRHVTALRDETVRADLTLIEGCIIRGAAVTRDGAPATAGPVELDVGRDPPNEFAPVARLAADGSFRIARTEPGPVRLRAWPWKSPPTDVVAVECADGARIDDVRLVVEAPGDPGITGALIDETGARVAGFVDLTPLWPGGIAQQERTDDAGAFAFYRVPPGPYRLSSHVDGYGVVRGKVNAPADGVELQLSGTGALSGLVRGADHGSFTLVVEGCREPGADRFAIDRVAMPPRAFLVPIDDGTFHVGGLPACQLEGRAETAFRSVRFAASITTQRPAQIELDLRRPRPKQLYGLVLDGDEPVHGVAIVRLPSSGTRRAATDYALTGSDGRYQLSVFTGDRVHLAAQDGREIELSIDWDNDREEHVTTVLPR